MEKLTIEHLAPYLPYGLKIEILNYKCDYVGIQFSEITGFYMIGEALHVTYKGGSTGKSIDDFKPFLRPLSDLTKEIDHNGAKFTPIDYNAFKHSKDDIIEYQNGFLHYKAIKFGIIQRLFEWHFDVFSLIDKGLAIDINSTK